MELPVDPLEVATPRVVTWTKGWLFVAGGLICLVLTWGVRGATTGSPAVLGALGAIGVLTGAGLLLGRPQLTARRFHVLVALSSGLITIGVLVAPDGQTALAAAGLCTLIAVDAFFFYAGSAAVVQLGFALAATTTALLTHPDVGVSTVVARHATTVVVAAAIAGLARYAAGATRDSLTGLVNRRGFDTLMRGALLAADRSGGPLSVALIDLDHFKRVNDTEGHEAGDDLLRQIAAAWSAALPEGALLARHGGDEFAVLLPGFTGPLALTAVERLRVGDVRVGLSAGVAQRRPGEPSRELLARADAAAYRAKAAGRGRCVLSEDDGASLAVDLADALAHRELQVHYQPLVTLPVGRTVGVEALARWTHPVRGRVAPDEFVAVAEAEGLIGALGAFVLERACRDAARLCRAVGRDLLLTVNVSGGELVDPGYPELIARVLRETEWPASQLVLEVTETLVEGGSAPALAALTALRDLGVAVAIDDFGTGYSSLSRLDTVPASYLKLDSTFVSDVSSPRRARLLGAIAALARGLGLRLVAEGVETEQQAEVLTRLGAPLAQGYLYGAPQPVGQLAARLSSEQAVPLQRLGQPVHVPAPVAAPAA